MKILTIVACILFSYTIYGATLDLQKLIDAAFAKGGGVVRVPAGKHEVKPFVLKSNITLKFEEGAQIFASTNINDYSKKLGARCFIYAENATNVAIIGKGLIDGRGSGFREIKGQRGEQQPQALPILMRFSKCRNLRLEGFKYTNPGAWGCHLRNCDGVTVKKVSCYNYCNKTNDGLDIESCNVTVEDCDFFADDDSLCFKTESDKSFPVTNVVVRNCRMGSICNAIKFGTGSYSDFRDILIENCEFRRTPGAWRWNWSKSMPGVTYRYCGIAVRASEVVDGGRMENVTIRNLKMEGYMTPIFIRHSNRHGPKGKGNTDLRNILIENVTGECDSLIASSITGVPAKGNTPSRRPENITLRNINLLVPGGGTAKHASARVPEKDRMYPEAFMFNNMPLPAYGFYVRHADRINFENVTIKSRTPDERKLFIFDDCKECSIK
jgi:polygalacturonase